MDDQTILTIKKLLIQKITEIGFPLLVVTDQSDNGDGSYSLSGFLAYSPEEVIFSSTLRSSPKPLMQLRITELADAYENGASLSSFTEDEWKDIIDHFDKPFAQKLMHA